MTDVRIPLEDWNTLRLKALFFVPKYVNFYSSLSSGDQKGLAELSKKISAEAGKNGDEAISSPAERSIRKLQPVTHKKAKAAISLMQHFNYESSDQDIIFAAFFVQNMSTYIAQSASLKQELSNHLSVSKEFVDGLVNKRRTTYVIAKKVYDFLKIENEVQLSQFIACTSRNKIYQAVQDVNGESELSSAQLLPAPRTGHPWAIDDAPA